MKRFLLTAALSIGATLMTGGYLHAAGERPPRISTRGIPPSNADEIAAEERAEKNFQNAAGQAHAAIKKSRELGGEWQGASKLLMQAAAAAQAGELDEAARLAEKAQAQAEESYRKVMSGSKAETQ